MHKRFEMNPIASFIPCILTATESAFISTPRQCVLPAVRARHLPHPGAPRVHFVRRQSHSGGATRRVSSVRGRPVCECVCAHVPGTESDSVNRNHSTQRFAHHCNMSQILNYISPPHSGVRCRGRSVCEFIRSNANFIFDSLRKERIQYFAAFNFSPRSFSYAPLCADSRPAAPNRAQPCPSGTHRTSGGAECASCGKIKIPTPVRTASQMEGAVLSSHR